MALEKTLQQNFTQKTLQTKLIIQLWLEKKLYKPTLRKETLQTNHPAVAPAESMRFLGMREQRGNRLD